MDALAKGDITAPEPEPWQPRYSSVSISRIQWMVWGKSWFLQRFKAQLAINYPVAFVDAWVDDANNEPLVSIMAALEDCNLAEMWGTRAAPSNIRLIGNDD
jgi:hypothetical protein